MREDAVYHPAVYLACLLYLYSCMAITNADVTTVAVGNDMLFPCSSDLDPGTDYLVWKKDNVMLTVGRDTITADIRVTVSTDENVSAMIQSHTSLNLRIKEVVYGDKGNYTCVQYNRETKKVTMVTSSQMIVEGPPLPVTLSTEDIEVEVGSAFVINGQSFANPEPNVKFEKYCMLQSPQVVSSKSTFQVHSASVVDEGEYRCSASNTYSTTTHRYFQVHVKRNVTSFTEPKDNVKAGNNATLTCIIDGYPEPSEVTWERVDARMPNVTVLEKHRLWNTERRHQIRVELVIENVEPSDDGIYRCVAYDSVNTSLTESAALLKVMYMGNITSISTPSLVDENACIDVELECTAKGYPPPLVIWRKVQAHEADKKLLDQDISHRMGQKKLLDQDVGYGTGQLRLKKVTVEDAGEYECIASNGYGPVQLQQTSITVKTHGVPFKTPVILTDIGRHNVSIKWQRNRLSTRSQDEYYAVTCTDLTSGKAKNVTTDFSSSYQSNDTYSVTIDTLSPSTSYEMRVIARNTHGSSASDPIRMTTFGEGCKLFKMDNGYKGSVSKSSNNKDCLRWDSSMVSAIHGQLTATLFPDRTVQEASNYCRNPTRSYGGPWCYVLSRRQYYGYGGSREGQFYVVKENCKISPCLKEHTPPEIKWIGCSGNDCELTTELSPQETGSTISVNCRSTYNPHYPYYGSILSYSDKYVYYYSTTSAQVNTVKVDVHSLSLQSVNRMICSFTTTSDKGSTSKATVLQINLTNCSRYSDEKKPNPTPRPVYPWPAVSRKSSEVPTLELTGLPVTTMDTAFINEGQTRTVVCQGKHIGNATLSLRKDGEIFVSDVFYNSSWRTEAPFFPRLTNVTGDRISLTVDVTFDPEAAGTYTCVLDTYPPIVVTKQVSVIRKCEAD